MKERRSRQTRWMEPMLAEFSDNAAKFATNLPTLLLPEMIVLLFVSKSTFPKQNQEMKRTSAWGFMKLWLVVSFEITQLVLLFNFRLKCRSRLVYEFWVWYSWSKYQFLYWCLLLKSVFGLSCDPTSGEACLLWEKTQLLQYDLRISHWSRRRCIVNFF